MRSFLTILCVAFAASVSAQTDTLRFWNGEYMVVRNDSVIYPTTLIKEQATEFAGGDLELSKFIQKNIRMPEQAKKSKVGGRVDAIFYVDKTGMPSRLTVRGDTTLGRGEEARRLIALMPRWKPAIQNGRPVQMRMLVQVAFAAFRSN